MQETATPQLLRSLLPAAVLRHTDVAALASKTQIEEYPAGRQLFVRGHRDRWCFFVVSGRVRLEWGDGRSEVVSGGSEAAGRPLAAGQPRPATALTQERVRFIRFDNTLLEVLGEETDGAGYEVEEIGDGDPQPYNRLLFTIYHDYLADRLELPHLPEIAFKVRSALEDPECDAAAVARIIQTDPVLAARLVQAANSPLYGVQIPINSCRAAVMYMGLNVTRDLVLAYTLRDLFRTDSSLLRLRMTELWRHSALVGAVSFVLAGMTPGLDRDRALLAGLLHDIGALPVVTYAGHMPELTADPDALERAIEALRAQVGAMVLRRWKFGDEMVQVALESHDWQRDPGDGADYADVVLVAQRLLDDGCDEHAVAALTALPAWPKLARGRLDVELAQQVVAEAQQDVADVLQLLA